MFGLFRKKLPCHKEQCFGEDVTPRCLQPGAAAEWITCPVSVKLRESIDRLESQCQRSGYAYMAWVVRRGPNCELVCFQHEPDERERRELYGDDLITIVPI